MGHNLLDIHYENMNFRRIYDIVLNAPGSYHDAAVWQMSRVKGWASTLNPRYYILGDSAYPLSDHCLTPYPEEQAQEDFNKALFNIRHSGARVEHTECVYGMLKRRFPIIKQIRYKYFLNSICVFLWMFICVSDVSSICKCVKLILCVCV